MPSSGAAVHFPVSLLIGPLSTSGANVDLAQARDTETREYIEDKSKWYGNANQRKEEKRIKKVSPRAS